MKRTSVIVWNDAKDLYNDSLYIISYVKDKKEVLL